MALSDYITSGSDGTGSDGKLYKEVTDILSGDRSILDELQFNIIDYKKYSYNNTNKVIDQNSKLIIAWNKPSASYKDWEMRS